MATYLITGGCGFIGSHLGERLSQLGHRIRILDNDATGKHSALPFPNDYYNADISDANAMNEALDGVDACYHLAWSGPKTNANGDWLHAHITNLTGTVSVLNAIRKTTRRIPFLYASSATVYGDNSNVPLTEQHEARPTSPFGACNLSSELHARIASICYKIPTIGFRMFNIYGPNQDMQTEVIPNFINNILRGEPLVIFGDGDQLRDFVYVKDAVDMLARAAAPAGTQAHILNVCTGRGTSIKVLARTLFSIFGQHVPIIFAARRPADAQNSVGDPTRTERYLGTTQRVDLGYGLRQTIATLLKSTVAAPARKIA